MQNTIRLWQCLCGLKALCPSVHIHQAWRLVKDTQPHKKMRQQKISSIYVKWLGPIFP